MHKNALILLKKIAKIAQRWGRTLTQNPTAGDFAPESGGWGSAPRPHYNPPFIENSWLRHCVWHFKTICVLEI